MAWHTANFIRAKKLDPLDKLLKSKPAKPANPDDGAMELRQMISRMRKRQRKKSGVVGANAVDRSGDTVRNDRKRDRDHRGKVRPTRRHIPKRTGDDEAGE